MGILLAPYNDSMRLGQGYNSFLQSPCLYNAVIITKPDAQDVDVTTNPSQTVSYTSHVVNRISDVTRSMGVSTGSSVKNGSIALSGNASSIDESKFVDSHVNVILSVKVINRTVELNDKVAFDLEVAEKAGTMDNERFHEVFGDCYISGFIEGGDLHGVISIKVLDSSRKEEIKSSIARDINNLGATDMSFNHSDLSRASGSRTNGCETTIAVNWSGGGQIKQDEKEWTLDTLYRVAAGFPARVAACPQRTWAILTPYDNNPAFVQWRLQKQITPHDYSEVASYASDLLDAYMGYKNIVRRIQAVLSDPEAYVAAPGTNKMSTAVEKLVLERQKAKDEMEKIMGEIDKLNKDPKVVADSTIEAPELVATRLPVPRNMSTQERDALEKFARLQSDPPHRPTEPASTRSLGLGKPGDEAAQILYDAERASLTQEERKALDTELNRRILARYRFDASLLASRASASGTALDSKQLGEEIRMNAVFSASFGWPTSVRLIMSYKGQIPVATFHCTLGEETSPFPDQEVHDPQAEIKTMTLGDNHRITSIRVGKTEISGRVYISYIEIESTGPPKIWVGKQPSHEENSKDLKRPENCTGLAFLMATARHYDIGAVSRLLVAWE